MRIGFDGYYKVGRWTPAVVQFDSDGPADAQLVAHAPDPEGCSTSIPFPAQAPRAGSHSIEALFKSGRLYAQPWFELVELDTAGRSGRTLPVTRDAAFRIHPALPQSAFLIALLGEPAGFEEAAVAAETPSSDDTGVGVTVARLRSGRELPSAATGFESLDVLMIAGEYDLDAQQSEAVRDWVRLGGHLIVSVGSEIAAYADSPLGRWISGNEQGAEAPVPLAATEPVRLRELSTLESFSGQRIQIEIPRREGIPTAALDAVRGNVLVRARGDVPLVVRAPYGFGRVTVIGIDVDRPPLSEWPPISVVMSRLAGLTELTQRAAAPSRTGRLAHSGITDLASQLAQAQRSFPQVERSSLWTVLGLLVGYLVLIGPIDYVLVHRVLRRPHLTWVTFPLLVAAAAVLAGWTARRTNGEQVRINRLDLLDIDGQFQTVRARSWLTLYTPETRRFAVDARAVPHRPDSNAAADQPETRICWSGTPENVFGGMYRAGGLEVGRPPYAFDSRASAIRNLPLSVWATKDIEGQWHNQAAAVVESQLTRTAVGQLRGRLTHHLPGTIEDWIVAVGRRVYIPARRGEPVPLRPGRPWPADAEWESLPQRDLTAWLSGTVGTRTLSGDRRFTNEDYRPSQRKYAPFDPGHEDPLAEILRMITFHRAAGGKAYTGLDNHGFRREELTELLDAGRAVLFGRIDFTATEFKINGQPVSEDAGRHSAFVRIVLPLAPEPN